MTSRNIYTDTECRAVFPLLTPLGFINLRSPKRNPGGLLEVERGRGINRGRGLLNFSTSKF